MGEYREGLLAAARVAIEQSEKRACSVPYTNAATARQVGLDIQSAILALAERTETPPNPAGQVSAQAEFGRSAEANLCKQRDAAGNAAPALPGPMVSVPIEPTEAMLVAAWNASSVGRSPDEERDVWKAMLAAHKEQKDV